MLGGGKKGEINERAEEVFGVAFTLEEQKEEADLRDRIEQFVVEYSRYGYRRVTWQPKREGWKVNHKRVHKIMREESFAVSGQAALGKGH